MQTAYILEKTLPEVFETAGRTLLDDTKQPISLYCLILIDHTGQCGAARSFSALSGQSGGAFILKLVPKIPDYFINIPAEME